MDPRRAAHYAATFEELAEDAEKPTTALLEIPLPSNADEHVVLRRLGPSTAEQKHAVPLTEKERQLYSALYVKNLKPIKKVTAAIEVDLVALQEEFKEHFDHTKFALIWAAFYDANKEDIPNPSTTTAPQKSHYYTFENLKYNASTWIQEVVDRSSAVPLFSELHIQLSNDGYLYSPHHQLKPTKDGISHHHSQTVCILPVSDYKQIFKPLLVFANEWLKQVPSYDPKETKVTIYYDYEQRKLDLTVNSRSAKRNVHISFEPGYPEDPVEEYSSSILDGLN